MSVVVAAAGMSFSEDIEEYPEGIIVPVDKPYRWTSADVIRKMKFAACRHFHKKNLKVGHAGTLDPLATGVLLVCIGKATKLADELQKHDKEYLAGISFGATTASYDREKEVDKFFPLDAVSKENLESVLPEFIGEQEQIAPLFSAKSVDGVRAYEMARKEYKAASKNGTEFDHSAEQLLSKQLIRITSLSIEEWCPDGVRDELPPADDNVRNNRINVTDISSLHLPHASIRVGCSKGTYIRALARDLGEALGSGAFLDSLRRTKTGSFDISESLCIGEAMELFF